MKKPKTILIIILLVFSGFIYAQNVRGMLIYPAQNNSDVFNYIPHPYLEVYLVENRVTSNYNLAGCEHNYITGSDGMYYFYDVEPGSYYLVVRYFNGNILQFTINIRNVQNGFFDIAAIEIP
jgi:hypothetical protein